MQDSDNRPVSKLVSRLISLAALISRPMTLGVRGLVLDPEGRVFLVRHTYVDGWYLPGGGVEGGETLQESLARELLEEGNIELKGAPQLYGVYLNRTASPRNHVALYVVRDFRQTAPHTPDREIAEAAFFALDSLPDGATRATRARIAEVGSGAAAAAYW